LNELYHASPLSPEAYFVGIAGGMLVAYLPPSLFVLAILEILHPLSVVAWLVLATCLLAVWAVSSTIGYVVSTLFKDMKTIWPYSALLTNLFGVVPPVFYRLGSVPVGWRSVALLLPTSAAAVLVDSAAGLETLTRTEATVAAVVLAAEALVLFAFGIYWARRTARERWGWPRQCRSDPTRNVVESSRPGPSSVGDGSGGARPRRSCPCFSRSSSSTSSTSSHR